MVGDAFTYNPTPPTVQMNLIVPLTDGTSWLTYSVGQGPGGWIYQLDSTNIRYAWSEGSIQTESIAFLSQKPSSSLWIMQTE